MTIKQFSKGAFLWALCVFANSASLLAMEGGRKRPSGDDLNARPLKQRRTDAEEACAAPLEAAAAQPSWVAQTNNLTQRLFSPNSWRDHVCCVQAPQQDCMAWLTTEARNHNPCLQIDASDAGLNAPDEPLLMQRHGNEVYIVLNHFMQQWTPIPTLEDPAIETLKLVINVDDNKAGTPEAQRTADFDPDDDPLSAWNQIDNLRIDLSFLKGLVGLHSLHVDVRIDDYELEEFIVHEMDLKLLEQLPNLRYLSLHGPFWNFAPLKQLKRLAYLHLNPVGGPENPGADGTYLNWQQLSELPLETLIVDSCYLDVSCLVSMPTLQNFVLFGAFARHLSSVARAENLKYAALDIPFVHALPVQRSEDTRNSNCLSLPASLEALYLQGGSGDFSLEALAGLTQLKELYLETHNKAENWGVVAALPNLEVAYKRKMFGLAAVETVCGAQNLKALLLPNVHLAEVALRPANVILEKLLPRAAEITHLLLPEHRVEPFPDVPEAFANLKRLISYDFRGAFTDHAL